MNVIKLECYRCGTTHKLIIEEKQKPDGEKYRVYACVTCSDNIIEINRGKHEET